MAVTQIHLRPAEPETSAPVVAGWKLAGPLTGWRDDDPDALPRCSIDREHLIRNGELYAVTARPGPDEPYRMACLPCAGIAAPPVVERPAPVVRPPALNAAARKFSGLGPRRPTPALAPDEERRCARAACGAAFTVRPSLQRRFCSQRCAGLLAWEASGRPRAVPTAAVQAAPKPAPRPRERRICARDGCERTFVVLSAARRQRFCSQSCAARATQPAPSREQRTCPVCDRTFTVGRGRKRQQYCSCSCAGVGRWRRRLPAPRVALVAAPEPTPVVVASTPADALLSCPCLGHAQERLEQGIAPLPIVIGRHTFPALPPAGRTG